MFASKYHSCTKEFPRYCAHAEPAQASIDPTVIAVPMGTHATWPTQQFIMHV
jgi:hypothetical protein